MSRFIDMVMLVMACSVPVIVMGLSALLIRAGVDGWGWYLFCAFCISHAYMGVIGDCAREVVKK